MEQCLRRSSIQSITYREDFQITDIVHSYHHIIVIDIYYTHSTSQINWSTQHYISSHDDHEDQENEDDNELISYHIISDKSISSHNILHSTSYLLAGRQWVAVTCLYGYGEDVSNAKQFSCKFMEPDNV